jgi:hypothetical protein
MTVDLLGRPLDPDEERLLAVYEELKALCADQTLPPNAHANVVAALALMHDVVNGLALKYEHEHLSDLGAGGGELGV